MAATAGICMREERGGNRAQAAHAQISLSYNSVHSCYLSKTGLFPLQHCKTCAQCPSSGQGHIYVKFSHDSIVGNLSTESVENTDESV